MIKNAVGNSIGLVFLLVGQLGCYADAEPPAQVPDLSAPGTQLTSKTCEQEVNGNETLTIKVKKVGKVGGQICYTAFSQEFAADFPNEERAESASAAECVSLEDCDANCREQGFQFAIKDLEPCKVYALALFQDADTALSRMDGSLNRTPGSVQIPIEAFGFSKNPDPLKFIPDPPSFEAAAFNFETSTQLVIDLYYLL